jgi:hypothetical protein
MLDVVVVLVVSVMPVAGPLSGGGCLPPSSGCQLA